MEVQDQNYFFLPGEEDLYQCIFDYREGLELGNFTEEESPSPVGCENSVGSYKCICPQGYEYIDKMCVNINECPGKECINFI